MKRDEVEKGNVLAGCATSSYLRAISQTTYLQINGLGSSITRTLGVHVRVFFLLVGSFDILFSTLEGATPSARSIKDQWFREGG